MLTTSLLPALILLGLTALVITRSGPLTQLLLRDAASRQLSVRLSPRFRVLPLLRRQVPGSFTLAYPRWPYTDSSSSRGYEETDDRGSGPWSVLEVGRWKILCHDVYHLYELVLEVRAAGTPVAYSDHEILTRRAARDQVHPLQGLTVLAGDEGPSATTVGAGDHAASETDPGDTHRGLDAIIAHCDSRPTAFESFCADLFRAHGYHVAVTPSSRPRGFNLRLLRNQRISLVECLYDQHDPVDVPVVERLRSASAREHADALVVVTTGSFTLEATSLARQKDVRLVDGQKLVAMCRQVWGTFLESTAPTEVGPVHDVVGASSRIPGGGPHHDRERQAQERGFSRISQVSMTSPSAMSLNPRLIPHS
ncbi:restriction endonuclease [Actinomyces lilanjuaniae]|uniref:restriction endonuclease n=1 Tax=Actinomyces lilanjuaniae TaxID=2321394 RepID=UPI0013C48117|nr:restriction endonuclease [Actinomyces lilanjuaniae]